MMKAIVLRTALALCVVMASGCSRAEQSVVRRDYLLAAEHGWVNLTVNVPSSVLPQTALCTVEFSYNGENVFLEMVMLQAAPAGQPAMGYRFPAPVGALQTELRLSGCIKKAVIAKLPVTMKKDHVASLAFDGLAMNMTAMDVYEPTSLEWVRAEMLKLSASGSASASASLAAVSTLTWIAMGSLFLNLMVLMLLGWQWHHRRGNA